MQTPETVCECEGVHYSLQASPQGSVDLIQPLGLGGLGRRVLGGASEHPASVCSHLVLGPYSAVREKKPRESKREALT